MWVPKLDPKLKEILKYGFAFGVLLMAFFGGSYILKGLLGTEYPMMVVVSQSMVPTLGVGDYIIVAQVPDANQITAAAPPNGEIIVFLRPGSTEEYIVHRAIKRTSSNGSVSYVTKGDNNTFNDGIPAPSENVVGKVVGHIPIIGYFSLFIKTVRGFSLVIGFMILAFFIDYILPAKKPAVGRFPPLALLPLLVAPLATASLWFFSGDASHFTLESISICVWYFACLLIPLVFHDDDSGVMIWLYHLVLLMVPIACDMTWWNDHITPSMWWYQAGSTVPINWFLLKELPAFDTVFNSVLRSLLPGVMIFVVTLYAKRKTWEPFTSLHRRLRGASPDAQEEAKPIVPIVPDSTPSSNDEPARENT
jgi:signal peptidase